MPVLMSRRSHWDAMPPVSLATGTGRSRRVPGVGERGYRGGIRAHRGVTGATGGLPGSYREITGQLPEVSSPSSVPIAAPRDISGSPSAGTGTGHEQQKEPERRDRTGTAGEGGTPGRNRVRNQARNRARLCAVRSRARNRASVVPFLCRANPCQFVPC